jgi:hypothetical protein
LWRRVGFNPIVLLVGSREEWLASPRLRVTADALLHHAVEHQFLGRIDGYPDHTLAQNCRQHAGALPFDDGDWLMPADADLWPLNVNFYRRFVQDHFRLVMLYSNGDHFQGKEVTLDRTSRGLGSQTIPTCHVAMRVRDWRAIYQPVAGDVAASVKKSLDAWMPSRVSTEGYNANMALWMSDQQLMTVALCQQPWFPSGPPPQGEGAHAVSTPGGTVLFVNRRGHPPVDRLDRSHAEDWASSDVSRWVDAHVHRDPFSDEHWSSLHKLIEQTVPEHAAWAQEYRDAIVRVS